MGNHLKPLLYLPFRMHGNTVQATLFISTSSQDNAISFVFSSPLLSKPFEDCGQHSERPCCQCSNVPETACLFAETPHSCVMHPLLVGKGSLRCQS